MVRLKDIAERVGVSVMTVSKVMRDAPDISAATKARVRQVAEEMGYTPDTAARALRSRTSKLFGLVISAMTNPVYARIIMAIEEQAFELGYDVILYHTLNQPEREQAVIKRLLSRRVDGMFIAPVYRLDPTAAVYEELRRRQTPVVLLGPRAPFCEGFVSVETNDRAAAHTVTRHLLDLGHRRIAFLSGPAHAPNCREQLEGYRNALREAGFEADDRLVFAAGLTMEEGAKAALQMLNEGTDATALQTVNDLAAIGAANVFLNQGLRIPEDISIVGFGNVLLSEHFRVPLTTIRQPKLRLGAAAMESMLRLLRGEPTASKQLPAEIVVRKSSGPPGSGLSRPSDSLPPPSD